MAARRKVHIIVLGGTITMMPLASGGVAPELDGIALTKELPLAATYADISVATPFLVPSASITLDQIIETARSIREAIAGGAHGVVVVQGTDTIDETSFALDLLLDCTQPVVVTGAMRHPTAVGADGPANLLSAIIVAASPEADGRGVLVVLNDEIHAARYVEKTHTVLPSAFGSPRTGAIGDVVEGAARLFWGQAHAKSPALQVQHFADVALLKIAVGDKGRLIDAVAEAGYQGAVVEAMGGGHVPEWIADRVVSLARRIPVVLSTRVARGPVLQQTYGYKGAERELLASGLISAGRLSPTKARLLLAALLGAKVPAKNLISAFAQF